jgi:hypothetical protein
MGVIVFVGPSLARSDRAASGIIEFHPPARCGDITRVVAQHPHAIGLIDGVFELSAAVWHKEIIWALSQGCRVFGAASIGALRAAELEPFGMIGIGEIFRAYRDGATEDDDEVAVLHGPAELCFVAATEAMVNIRASLDRAVAQSILDPEEGARLCAIAKALFYKDRTWPHIRANAQRVGVSASSLDRFDRWRAVNAIDVKRRDAKLLIDAMLKPYPASPEPERRTVLNRTQYWVAHEQRFADTGTGVTT